MFANVYTKDVFEKKVENVNPERENNTRKNFIATYLIYC